MQVAIILGGIEAGVWLTVAAIGRRIVPWAAWFREAPQENIGCPPGDRATIESVRRSIAGAAARSPVLFTCRDRALAGLLMSRVRGARGLVEVSVTVVGAELGAHAALVVARTPRPPGRNRTALAWLEPRF